MRARFALVAVVVGAVFGGLIGPSVAAAEPSPAQIEAQIDKKWEQLEPVRAVQQGHAKLKSKPEKSVRCRRDRTAVAAADLAMNGWARWPRSSTRSARRRLQRAADGRFDR